MKSEPAMTTHEVPSGRPQERPVTGIQDWLLRQQAVSRLLPQYWRPHVSLTTVLSLAHMSHGLPSHFWGHKAYSTWGFLQMVDLSIPCQGRVPSADTRQGSTVRPKRGKSPVGTREVVCRPYASGIVPSVSVMGLEPRLSHHPPGMLCLS